MKKKEIVRRIRHVHEVLKNDGRILRSPVDTTPQNVAKAITKLYEKFFKELLDGRIFDGEE